jgi:hypothetical protein
MKSSYFYYVDVYSAPCYLFVGPRDKFYRYIRRLCKGLENTDELVPSTWAAGAFTFQHKDYGTKYVIWMPEFTGSCNEYGALAHEVLHCAINILDEVNIDFKKEHEALTYLMESIYRKFVYQLTSEMNKDRERCR